MKILYIIDKMKNLAGIERILTCKMNYLSVNTNHQIYLTTYEQQASPLSFSINKNVTYIPLDAPMPQRRGSTVFGWLNAYLKTRRLFKHQFKELLHEIHPDIVISTVYSYQVLDIIIKTSHHEKIKTIMESHIKGETVTMAKYQSNSLLYRLFTYWDHHIMRSLRQCNCVVTLTKGDTPYWKIYAPRVEVIPNMITITPKKVKDYHAKRIIAAGRYAHQKGYDMLLESWHLINKDFADWHLYIFGNEDRTPYQQIVDKYAMNSNVHLFPATPDIVDEFSKSSIYVMSSRFEGFPLVLGEAMSCGLPCISFDCSYGPNEIITDKEDGILVECDNVRELANQMRNLMSDVQLRQSMGEKAYKNIARYQPDTIMKQWINLFKNI